MKKYIGKFYKCVSNDGYKDFLTKNKNYEILDSYNNSVVIISDIDVKITLDKQRFNFNYNYKNKL